VASFSSSQTTILAFKIEEQLSFIHILQHKVPRMSNSDDAGVTRKAAIVKLLEHIEKSWEASTPPPPQPEQEYEKGAVSSAKEESYQPPSRATSRENENKHDGNQKKAGLMKEFTAKSNSSDLSIDPPPHYDHNNKAAQWSSSGGDQADDEDSGPDSMEDSSILSGDKNERNLKLLSSNDEESQRRHDRQLLSKHDEQQMRSGPKSSGSGSSASSSDGADSSSASEEKQFVVPENDFVVAIDDKYTVLPRVGTRYRGKFKPGCGTRIMPPPWTPLEQRQQQGEASKQFEDQQSDVQNDNDGSRRRNHEGEMS
jgi:hypothetical protein